MSIFYENLTSFTEVDPDGRLTETSSRVTFTAQHNQEIDYLYKDKGAAYFDGNFSHNFTLQVNSGGGASPYGGNCAWMMSNDLGGAITMEGAGKSFFFMGSYANFLGTWFVDLHEINSGVDTGSSTFSPTKGVPWYVTVDRDESIGSFGQLRARFYSDSLRTALVNTLTVTLHTSKKDFRYIHAIGSYPVLFNNSNNVTGFVENLDIGAVATNPAVSTQATSAITGTTATGNGTIIDLGVPGATQHGHVWATHYGPTTSDSKTTNGVPSATGAYTSSLTGLLPNTVYYCCSYITSDLGTFYGNNDRFTTAVGVPTVTTQQPSSVTTVSAVGNGSIVNLGGSPVTQYGVCWSTAANPTTADAHSAEGATTSVGNFTSAITGLTTALTYHVRSYAVNTSGTGYGNDVTFTATAGGVPIVRTDRTTHVLETSAQGNGTVIDTGRSAITQHGHVWGTSVNPTVSSFRTSLGPASVGSYFSVISNLAVGVPYYVRAYATNTEGTGYGDNELINQVAWTVLGNLAILGEHLAYVSKSGTQRTVMGEVF